MLRYWATQHRPGANGTEENCGDWNSRWNHQKWGTSEKILLNRIGYQPKLH